VKKYKLPTREQAFDMLKEYCVPLHILKHSLAVAELAVWLAEKLKEKGKQVDVDLVDRACLLHDIARVCDFVKLDHGKFEQIVTEQDKIKWEEIKAKYEGLNHEDAAYQILKEEYPVLALTIRRHKYSAMLNEEDKPQTWEEKIVYYADKRVMHDKVVPLKKRLEEGHKRNTYLHQTDAHHTINIPKIDALIHSLEREIFQAAGLVNEQELQQMFEG
jgi:uncharacterized protein